MEVKRESTGHTIDGEEVIAFKLINNKGNYVRLFNYGTIIQQFVVKNKLGEMQDIVLGFDDFAGYISNAYLSNYPYFGAVIGRYANRIKDGKFAIDGVTYQLPQNNDNDCLHGGIKGFDRKVWSVIDTATHPHASVTFQYFSLDGEENFPGDLAVQLTFELTNNDELILTYHADTDESTPINLTHHSYFNLSTNGGHIKQHLQQFNATQYLVQDNNYVVTGEVVHVNGTIHDFTMMREIGSNWNAEDGYDQTYVLDKAYGELTLASTTSAKDSGLSLEVYTTEPVAHFYTAKHLKVQNGKNGKNYNEFDAFCIETQHHPNAVNVPHFPNTILHPDENYKQTTIYKVKLM